MIGCIGYTDLIECSQYVNDVHLIKTLYLISLLCAAIFLIYYSKTESYIKLKTKYSSYNTMMMLPIGVSYVAVFTTLLGSAGLMSVNTSLNDFTTYIWVYLLPTIFWFVLMIYFLGMEWIWHKLGFANGKAFLKSTFKK